MVNEKSCSKCKIVKPLSAFSINKRMKLGVSSWCRECKYVLDKQYVLDNPEKYKKIKRKYYDNNKEKALARSQQWDRDNKDKANKRHSRYTKQHPEKTSVWNQVRRDRVKSAEGRGVTTQDWKNILELYGNKCLKCGSAEKITIDHVTPLIKGGLHDPSNIQPLCHRCNSGKRDKVADYRPK